MSGPASRKAPISPDAGGPKLKIRLTLGRDGAWWERLAADVLPVFAAERVAFVWPEAEYLLGETDWVQRYCDPGFPNGWHIDTHHLSAARSRLRGRRLERLDETLNRRKVSVWVLADSLAKRGNKTRTLAAAGSKRRAYRSFLGWTGDKRLCGDVGERAVWDVLNELKGTRLWLTPGADLGRVTGLQGRPLTVGGPLDAAGEWPLDPAKLAAGTVPFAVEVKNVRSMLYPYDHDVWDLIAKVAAFPDVLPLIVARRFHVTTFKMFKDLGVLGSETRAQFFSPSIPAGDFREVVATLGFADATTYEGRIHPGLRKFFAVTGPRFAQERLARWSLVAPIAANYPELRDESLDDGSRSDAFRDFATELRDAGLYGGGWAPLFEEDDEEPEGYDDY